jgi:hypothetical protein
MKGTLKRFMSMKYTAPVPMYSILGRPHRQQIDRHERTRCIRHQRRESRQHPDGRGKPRAVLRHLAAFAPPPQMDCEQHQHDHPDKDSWACRSSIRLMAK